jgi:hypothetical protein
MSKEKYEVLCNIRKDSSDLVTRSFTDLETCPAMATPGYTAQENQDAGLVGIRKKGSTES